MCILRGEECPYRVGYAVCTHVSPDTTLLQEDDVAIVGLRLARRMVEKIEESVIAVQMRVHFTLAPCCAWPTLSGLLHGLLILYTRERALRSWPIASFEELYSEHLSVHYTVAGCTNM